MKRRIKIVLSLCTLALACTMMVYGVWAATTHSFSVDNTISFTVNGNLSIQTTEASYGTVATSSTLLTWGSGTDYTGLDHALTTNWNGTSNYTSGTTTDITLDASKLCLVCQFTFKNNGPDAIVITLYKSATVSGITTSYRTAASAFSAGAVGTNFTGTAVGSAATLTATAGLAAAGTLFVEVRYYVSATQASTIANTASNLVFSFSKKA